MWLCVCCSRVKHIKGMCSPRPWPEQEVHKLWLPVCKCAPLALASGTTLKERHVQTHKHATYYSIMFLWQSQNLFCVFMSCFWSCLCPLSPLSQETWGHKVVKDLLVQSVFIGQGIRCHCNSIWVGEMRQKCLQVGHRFVYTAWQHLDRRKKANEESQPEPEA